MIKIQKAEIDNLNELAKLFDSYRTFYEKESDLSAGKAFLKDRLLNNESQIFVAFDKAETMTGFVQLYPVLSSTRLKRLWLLNDLFVHNDFRGGGISKALIEKAKEWCIETKSCGMILETAKTNNIANSLYVRTGFTLDNEHNYYAWDSI